jgi:hypothetical protein
MIDLRLSLDDLEEYLENVSCHFTEYLQDLNHYTDEFVALLIMDEFNLNSSELFRVKDPNVLALGYKGFAFKLKFRGKSVICRLTYPTKD